MRLVPAEVVARADINDAKRRRRRAGPRRQSAGGCRQPPIAAPLSTVRLSIHPSVIAILHLGGARLTTGRFRQRNRQRACHTRPGERLGASPGRMIKDRRSRAATDAKLVRALHEPSLQEHLPGMSLPAQP